jgi:hypothetical protein
MAGPPACPAEAAVAARVSLVLEVNVAQLISSTDRWT